MKRFCIIIFNYESIDLFLSNFDKIRNFDYLNDKIIIFDCSDNFQSELDKISRFSQKHGFKRGENIEIIRRKNWGIDQGGRLDFFKMFIKNKLKCKFVWQFQEHYLDTESDYSIWPQGKTNIYGDLIEGEPKEDIIPKDTVIDLDLCENIYNNNSNINVIFAINEGLGIYKGSRSKHFIIHGANFSVRASEIKKRLTLKLIRLYHYLYTGHYDWALFMECEFCRLFTSNSLLVDITTGKVHSIKEVNLNNDLQRYYCANDLFEEAYSVKRSLLDKLLASNRYLLNFKIIKKHILKLLFNEN